jgi:hypothetical protein
VITVAICTYDRAELLDATLGRIGELDTDGIAWELVLVDNNSSDGTAAVAARYASALPLRTIVEHEQGLSHARNAAVRAARGDHVVWTDDDVLVERGWLRAYRDAFERDPEAAIFGGPVRPWFPNEPPAWIHAVWPRIATAFAARDFGSERFPLGGSRIPFGANMAFRADTLREHPFDPALGLRPGGSLRGEETTVVRAMLDRGHHGWWVPDARVDHYIPVERQNVGYVRSFFREVAAFDGMQWEDADVEWFGQPRWLWRRLVVAHVRYALRRRTSPPEVWIGDLIELAVTEGRMRGYRLRGDAASGFGVTAA